MSSYFFEIPYPPSVNTYWRKWQNRMVLSAKGRDYSITIAKIIYPWIEMPLQGRLRVTMHLHRGDKRSYDIDNYSKGVWDAFTKCGFWKDDSQVDEMTVRRKALIKEGRAYILIEEISP